MGVAATVHDGTHIYNVTRTSPSANSESGYRWVHLLKRKGREWIFVSFIVKEKKYYKGGFASAESASRYVQAWHQQILDQEGISDPRNE